MKNWGGGENHGAFRLGVMYDDDPIFPYIKGKRIKMQERVRIIRAKGIDAHLASSKRMHSSNLGASVGYSTETEQGISSSRQSIWFLIKKHM